MSSPQDLSGNEPATVEWRTKNKEIMIHSYIILNTIFFSCNFYLWLMASSLSCCVFHHNFLSKINHSKWRSIQFFISIFSTTSACLFHNFSTVGSTRKMICFHFSFYISVGYADRPDIHLVTQLSLIYCKHFIYIYWKSTRHLLGAGKECVERTLKWWPQRKMKIKTRFPNICGFVHWVRSR